MQLPTVGMRAFYGISCQLATQLSCGSLNDSRFALSPETGAMAKLEINLQYGCKPGSIIRDSRCRSDVSHRTSPSMPRRQL